MEQTTLQRIGNAVRLCRTSNNLTQEQLADLTGISYTYISRLENGQKNATIQTLERIAIACKTDIFQMLALNTQEDPRIIEMHAYLMHLNPFERSKALNIIREVFRTEG